MALKDILNSALSKSISPEDYHDLLQQYAAEGKTSGQQDEDLIYYTKLNASRSKRILKTAILEKELVTKVRLLPKTTWILITETWCGDAANSIPVLAKIAAINDTIDLRIVFREENPELMNHFLTKGGKSIPKLIAMDESHNVLFSWGPRPEKLQEIYWQWREKENHEPYKEFQVTIQKWYNQDKSVSIQKELHSLISQQIKL